MCTRIPPVVSRFTSLLTILALLSGGVVILHVTSHSAHAQTQAPATVGQQPKEVQDLLVDLDDIDTLPDLLPLKLTPEQMDKLAAAILAAKTEYDKKALPLTSVPLLKMADEIHETRKKALAGTPVPAAFVERIKGLQTEVAGKRKALYEADIVSLSATCKGILSVDQVAQCAKMEIDAYKRNKLYNDKSSDAQYFNAYVRDVFIDNPRTALLLKAMHAAQPPK